MPHLYYSLLNVFTQSLAAQKPQGFLWLPVWLGLGVIGYFTLPYEPPWLLSALSCMSAIALTRACWSRDALRPWSILLLFLSLGFALAQYKTHSLFTPILQKKMSPVNVEGIIDILEIMEEGGGQRLTLKDVTIERLPAAQTPRKVRIKFRTPKAGAQDFKIGQRIKTLAGLNAPSAPVLPGGFDFQRHMFFKGIGATGFSYGKAEILDEGGSGFEVTAKIEALRHLIARKIKGALSAQQSAVTTALMTGFRGAITDEDQEAMRGAGLAHMLAISGLHIGLFSGVIFFFLRLAFTLFPSFALHHPIKKYAAACAILAAMFYMFIAGASVPTQRAVLMSSTVFLAIILDRWPLSMRLVAFAALCVLIIAPQSILSASFHLSFAAVAALVSFYEVISPWWRKIYRHAGFLRRSSIYVLGVCLTTIIATIATAPFSLFHFQTLALYGLLGNILAMPVLSFLVMPFAALSFFLMPLGLESWSLSVVGYGVELILKIAHYVSSKEGAVLHVKLWPLEGFLLLSMAFVMLVLLKGWARLSALFPLTGAIILIAFIPPPLPFFLLSSGAKLAAFQGKDGRLSFSALNKDYFVRDVWMRSYEPVSEKPTKWPKEGRGKREGGDQGEIHCGEIGCRLTHHDYKIDVLKKAEGFAESCAQADAIISLTPIRERCEGKIVIDKFDAFRNGAHGLYLDRQDRLLMKSTEELRGLRPWSARYQKIEYQAVGEEKSKPQRTQTKHRSTQ